MTYRAYFNRHREAPQVWSIDEGLQESEVNVINWETGDGCLVGSRYNGLPVNDNSPSAWVNIVADGYEIRQGVAYFYRRTEANDGR